MQITEKIRLYKNEINERNRDNLVTLTLGGTLICLAITVIGLILYSYTEFVMEYACFMLYMLLTFGIAKLCQVKKVKHIVLVYYCIITPVIAGGIMMGTFWDPEQPAITIYILINVMLLFLIDDPRRIAAYMIGIEAIFAICCYISKDYDVFMADMVDLLIYGSIAIGVVYFMLRGHVENVENYCMVKFESERDSLTKLYNRGCGENQTREFIEKRSRGVFIILDIDYFKKVNDTYGHKVGDETIIGVARILEAVFCQKNSVVFRLGGDEFGIFMPGKVNEDECMKCFMEVQKQVKNLKTSAGDALSVSVSAGCTICEGTEMGFEDIYNSSDSELYEIKGSEKGRMSICRM